MPEEDPQVSFEVALSEYKHLRKYSADGLARNNLYVYKPVFYLLRSCRKQRGSAYPHCFILFDLFGTPR